MKAIVVGIKKVKGTNKQGHPYTGAEVHYSYERYGFEGRAVASNYLSQHVLDVSDSFSVGDEVDIYYNQFAKVDCVKVV